MFVSALFSTNFKFELYSGTVSSLGWHGVQPWWHRDQLQNRRKWHNSGNMARRNKRHKIAFLYFPILNKSYYLTFIPSCHIFQFIAFKAIFMLVVVPFRPAKLSPRLDTMPPQAGHCARTSKNRNCSGFYQKTLWRKKLYATSSCNIKPSSC